MSEVIQITGSQMQVYREETVNATKQIIMQKKKDLINNTFDYKRDYYY